MIYTVYDYADVDAITEPKHVWHDVDKWIVYTGEDIPVIQAAIPDVISKRQLCIQLARDGIYQNVMDYITSLPANNEIKIGFETATEFHRYRDDVQQMFAFFQVDIDAFFIEAAKII